MDNNISITEYILEIKRQEGPETESYVERFTYKATAGSSVAEALRTLPVAWECGCLIRKCGACAMRINGRPALACNTFLADLPDGAIRLEPLSKFPVIRDLMVDRSVIYEKLKDTQIWLEDEADIKAKTQQQAHASASCIMCGCCLEVCPNFSCEGKFAGALSAVNAYRVLDETANAVQKKAKAKKYNEYYYAGCGKSLACHEICPIGIPVEELLVRGNRMSIWKRKR